MSDLKSILETGEYYYFKSGLIINSKVNCVIENKGIFSISFMENSILDVSVDKIQKVRRPGNVVKKFKWCYSLKNEDNECIGFIGK